ncbi:hypothetical protein GCM10019016_038370 [Streptomyces prasinosporus]|uniref:Uncharacterized protein n=1 Tax=Streptomyces prasinosporus TaxID=68256 RepID=A0ABP6TRK0_9ACTN
MLSDLLQAFLGDAASAGDVLQERDHVVRALRAAEGKQEQGVVGGGIEHVWHVSILPPGTDGRDGAGGVSPGCDVAFPGALGCPNK